MRGGALFLVAAILWTCVGCGQDEPVKTEADQELIIFCGITMIAPVNELMALYEQRTGVRSVMSYGGSKDLLNSITVNKVGDIYLPGAESFIADADAQKLLTDRAVVGANQAALFVRKGNPKDLSGDVADLARPGLMVAIGHPDLGSVGKEARDILERIGIYEKVVAASAMLLPDSKALSAALRDGRADAVLNWKAVLYTGDNAQFMDMLPLAESEARRHALTMAVTTYSKNPEAAKGFLDLCASTEGQAVFSKYGF